MIRFNEKCVITGVRLPGHEPKTLSKREDKKLRKGRLDPKKLETQDGRSLVFDPPLVAEPGSTISVSTESQPSKGPWWCRVLCWFIGHKPSASVVEIEPSEITACSEVRFCQRCGREV